MVTSWDAPASFTTSMPLPVTVKVWAAEPTFCTEMVPPFLTLSDAGVKTRPPDPCLRVVVPAPDEPLDPLLHAPRSTATTTIPMNDLHTRADILDHSLPAGVLGPS